MNIHNEFAKLHITFTEVFNSVGLFNTTIVTIPTGKVNYDWIDKLKNTKLYKVTVIDVKVLTPDPLAPDYLTIEFTYMSSFNINGHDDIVNVVKGVINE